MEENLSNYPKLWHLPLQIQAISTETAIFIATNQEKTNTAVIQIRIIISCTVNFLLDI